MTYHERKIGSIENGVNYTCFKKTKTASDAAVVRENDCSALPSFMQTKAVVNICSIEREREREKE